MYRHVDILNRNGYQAYVVHTKKGFRLTWFENDTKVIDWQMFVRLYHKSIDYIVLPENLGSRISAFPGKKVIFNQNIYYGFNVLRFNKINKCPYLDKDVKFVMAVSAHNKRYLKFIFPNIRVRRIYNGIDSRKFVYKTIRQKERIITVLTTKAPMDTSFLYQAILARARQGLNNLKDYRWLFIDSVSEKEMARIFGKTLIFLFLSLYESCPLMPLEAMLSGALVVAYKGGPYSEYLNNSNSFLIDVSNKLGLIKTIEDIVEKFKSRREELTAISQKAYESARNYSLEREEKSVIDFWREVLLSK